MKTKAYLSGLAVLLSAAAWAGGGQEDLQAYADAAGLTPRQVAMLLGSRTAYTTEYPVRYEQAERKMRRAISEGRIPVRALAQQQREDFEAATASTLARSDDR